MSRDSKYNPLFIEQFAKDTLGVREQHILDKIQAAYDVWYFNRTRAQVTVNPDSTFGEVDICFSIRTGGTEENPRKIYVSLNKNTGRIILREQKIHSQEAYKIAVQMDQGIDLNDQRRQLKIK